MGETKRLLQCLACNSSKLSKVIDLGLQPLANSFVEDPKEDIFWSSLAVNLCEDCSHCQLEQAVDPDLLYKNYAYVSGTTETLKQHFKDLVNYAVPWIKNSYDPTVLDIGCNDGSLLKEFKTKGCRVYGVDPAENIAELSKNNDIPVLVDYWNEDAAFKYREHKFDIICALNCLAHNDNPYGFLKGCLRALKDNGIIIIEFPLFTNTVDKLDLGQIYAEHHSYFTAKSFINLIERLGLSCIGITQFPNIHGGTVRFTLKRGNRKHCTDVMDLVYSEMLSNLVQKIKNFQSRVDSLVESLKLKLKELDNKGYLIVAYGASAKSSTLFNLAGIDSNTVSRVVDDNPLKQNKYCPGSNIRTYSPEVLKDFSLSGVDKLAILLTVHNFKSEVLKRLRILGLSGSILINYTPEVSEEII